MTHGRRLMVLTAFVLMGAVMMLPFERMEIAEGFEPNKLRMGLGIFVCIAFLWMTEALPLTVTALLVPVLATLMGTSAVKTALAPFADPLIAVFFGGFALAAAGTFGLALVITQHEAGDVDGRVRSATTMSIAGMVALGTVAVQGGFHLPTAAPGWWGLAGLTFLYGTAFTIMFTVLPKLGVVGNSAIMNIEPIFALVLAWALLGQSIAAVQVAGGLLVVATVMWLGLRKG